jgi:hypothetical protein
MTERRKHLLEVLTNIQNHPSNQSRDIMSFAGMCNETELSAHVAACAARIEKREEVR